MTSNSLAQPADAATSLFGVVQLPLRWYPLALIAFFSLMSMRFEVELLAAWVIAVGMHHANNGMPLHPKVAWLRTPLHKLLPASSTVAAFEETGGGGGGQTLGGGTAPKLSLRAGLGAGARLLGRLAPVSLRKHYIGAGAATGQQSFGGGSSFGGGGVGGTARARNAPAASSLGSSSGFTAVSGRPPRGASAADPPGAPGRDR